MPALGAGVDVVDDVVGFSVVVGVGQSNEVIGGRVVQALARSVLVWTAYVEGESPHMHQPGPSAIAGQVFWGSASW